MEFREVEVQDRRRRRLRIQIENEDSTAVGRIRVAGRLRCWAREDCWSTKREPLEERGVEFISALRPCSPVEWTPERILACPGGQTAAPTLASAFPGYRAFSSLLLPPTTRPCISRVGGTPMTKVHARYAQPEFCPTLSLFKFSWPHFYFVSLRFSSRKFRTRGFLRIRLKRVVDIIIGYIEEFFEGFYADVTRSNRDDSKFKHVSSTCVQRYFRKCHVVCQLTSLYSVMQTLPSVFAFNLTEKCFEKSSRTIY